MDVNGKEKLICHELGDMLSANSIEASDIDDVVYSYIGGILEESMDDVDMVEFISIMEAYIPGFGHIRLEDVTQFMMKLQVKISEPPSTDIIVLNKQATPDLTKAQPAASFPHGKHTGRHKRTRKTSSRQNSESEHHTNISTAHNSTVGLHSWSDITAPTAQRSISECSCDSANNWPGLAEDNSVRPRYDSSTKSSSPATSTVSSRTNSESNTNLDYHEDSTADDTNILQSLENSTSENVDEMVQLLTEMFPDKCSTDIECCLQQNNNDLETTVVCLLDDEAAFTGRATELRRQKKPSSEDSITVRLSQAVTPKSKQKKGQRCRRKSSNSQDDSVDAEAGMEKLSASEMKTLILDKYSYIPTDADSKTYKPKLVTNDDKKMVRYRNGQIVSTKGERYSEAKSAMTDEMKKTYINLKPAKQYRFH